MIRVLVQSYDTEDVECSTLVRSTYIPPQLLDASLIKEIAETYQWNFRRIFIEQPRVRLDGVYIAVCHYMYVILVCLQIRIPLTLTLSDELA